MQRPGLVGSQARGGGAQPGGQNPYQQANMPLTRLPSLIFGNELNSKAGLQAGRTFDRLTALHGAADRGLWRVCGRDRKRRGAENKLNW